MLVFMNMQYNEKRELKTEKHRKKETENERKKENSKESFDKERS